ncbi:adenosylcobinamide-GDP ribazoletransferase [Colwellia psychrerythraea]|uniref:Adenosylcobinamide-GDP ribazoletransferase n=1 Tax=Colwellia psychrerythraea (strain 34H / ATCC BAA-681) TaxID=167879 RepID=Q47XZ4_COLP3|nr:adenosylcobinamide-GDP ribazoletransferase [Colwellia psychrerythraea]AAZ27397.1 cobalamin 5'-phosphate synthase [Colwellia psychrerythraea 34H]
MSVSVNEPLKNKVAAQLNLFYLALSFFTRLPVPKTMHYSEALLNKANRYFSLVGLVTGLLLALSYVCFSTFLPANISILLTMTISLLLTGAFHEDGLADMADGIGGAFTIEKRLTIMKDSRIGTYGAVTLVMALLLKFTLLVKLAEQDSNHLLLAILLAEVLSRAVAGSLISSMPYVSDIEQSKSKPLAQAQSSSELTILLLIGLAPLIFYSSEVIFSLLIVLVLFRWLFKQWLMARIGGFTGDCLGAGQQLSELLIYLTIVSYINKDVFIEVALTGHNFMGHSLTGHSFMGIVG